MRSVVDGSYAASNLHAFGAYETCIANVFVFGGEVHPQHTISVFTFPWVEGVDAAWRFISLFHGTDSHFGSLAGQPPVELSGTHTRLDAMWLAKRSSRFVLPKHRGYRRQIA